MGFVKFASDYEADQKAMQAEADGLQDLVLSSENCGPSVAAPWADFYKALSAFTATPVYDVWRPGLPDPHFIATSGLADTFASYASQLEGWRVTINGCAGAAVPGFADPTGQQAAGSVVGAIKGLAIAAGACVGLVLLVSVLRR